MRNLLPEKIKYYEQFADTVYKRFRKLRYGISSAERGLDLSGVRKNIVDWQSNEDFDALTETSIRYTTYLPVSYDDDATATVGGAGVINGNQAIGPLRVAYPYSGTSSQNIIEVTGNGCITRINLNPAITIDNSSGGTANYTHIQSVASLTWTINHNLGFIPNVFVLDSNGIEIIGSVDSASSTQIVISFSQAVSGTAYLT